MKYYIGKEVCISLKELVNSNSELPYTRIETEQDGGRTDYFLYNEFDELACLDGEACTIDHLVTENVYDLRNDNGETSVHFMMTKQDLDTCCFM